MSLKQGKTGTIGGNEGMGEKGYEGGRNHSNQAGGVGCTGEFRSSTKGETWGRRSLIRKNSGVRIFREGMPKEELWV